MQEQTFSKQGALDFIRDYFTTVVPFNVLVGLENENGDQLAVGTGTYIVG